MIVLYHIYEYNTNTYGPKYMQEICIQIWTNFAQYVEQIIL